MSNKGSSDTRPPRKALGRGLGALLESRTPPAARDRAAPAPAAEAPHGAAPETFRQIPVALIEPSPDQPRRKFPAQGLDELAASIRQHGILQPIVVAPAAGGKFVLVAGERRWRAAKLAGLEQLPALVQQVRRDESLELALIENLQREDLNPIEAASAFERLAQEFGLTHEEIARRTGKERSSITNYLRLLRLPPEVQQLVAESRLSMGHAKALLGLPSAHEQQRLANEVVTGDLSVRATEKLVTEALVDESKPKKTATARPWDPNIRAALQDLERSLGTRVRLSGTPKKGRLIIEYYSADDLMRLYDVIMKAPE